MSKLQDLVPPKVLCTLIPDGEFADSCLVYWRKKIILRRSTEKIVTFEKFYPAPTLQEIMEKIDKMTCSITTVSKLPSSWKIDTIDKEDNLFVRRSEKSPVSAALRLWLELMGVGSEEKNE